MKGKLEQAFLAILVVLIGTSAYGEDLWSIDFENGFNASSGTLALVGGDPANPLDNGINTDPNNMVHLRFDPARPDDHECRVGYNATDPLTYKARLGFEGLDPEILGPSGKVSIDFRVPVAGVPGSTAAFVHAVWSESHINEYWWIGMSKPYRVWIKAQSSVLDGTDTGVYGEKSYTADLAEDLTVGWHNMRFEWTRTVAEVPPAVPYDNDDPDQIRERANLRLYIDDELIISEDNVYWTRPAGSVINVGSFWSTSISRSFFECGNQVLMLDNIVFSTPDYLPEDVNQDGYVNLADLAAMAANWGECTDPQGVDCLAY